MRTSWAHYEQRMGPWISRELVRFVLDDGDDCAILIAKDDSWLDQLVRVRLVDHRLACGRAHIDRIRYDPGNYGTRGKENGLIC